MWSLSLSPLSSVLQPPYVGSMDGSFTKSRMCMVGYSYRTVGLTSVKTYRIFGFVEILKMKDSSWTKTAVYLERHENEMHAYILPKSL